MSQLNEKYSPLSSSIPSLAASVNGNGCESAFYSNNESSATGSSSSPIDPSREFISAAQDLMTRLTSALRGLAHERERLKLVLETAAETNSISSARNAPSVGNIQNLMLDRFIEQD